MPGQVYWFAMLYELKLGAAAAMQTHKYQEEYVKHLKVSKMNRLQRSIVSTRVASVLNDSTVQASKFLIDTARSLYLFSQDNVVPGENWEVIMSISNSVSLVDLVLGPK